MKEELYKYLSIGLLALLLLVCFGSLITYFVVGQESINNVAYALQSTTGYYDTNYVPNNYCYDWDYDYTLNSTTVTLYSDTNYSLTIYGTGSILNNVITCTGGSYITLRFNILTSDFDTSATKNWCFGVDNYVSGSCAGDFYSGYRSGSCIWNSTYNVFTTNTSGSSNPTNFAANSYCNVYIYQGYSVTLRFLGFYIRSSFNGYVPKTYESYGYNQGYTDGVNSASGGTVTGVNDLTGLTWEVPNSVTEQLSVSSVDYSVTGYAVRVDGDNSYTYNFTTLNITNDLTFTNLVSAIFYRATGFSRAANSGDLIYFTGGEDVTNTDLIQWLEDNNTFKSYTEGYQDGYNSGYDVGYEDGYAQGNLDTIVTLDTYLQPFGSSTFTGLINQDPTTFWWSVQPGMQPNTAVYGYLCFNISSLPIGSIVHFNFPFQKYTLKDTNNNSTDFTDVRVFYDVDYYTNLLIAPRDSLPSIRFEQGTETYSFNVIRPGDTIILYFPLNLVTNFDRYTFALTWSGDEYNYSFTTSSISQDIKTQLDNAYERGLKDGNSQGYTNGYTVGYNEGADGAEHYTFNNLLGAVFDAPITMFLGKYNPQTRMREGGLFNFELLGVNLTGFVIALLSIGVVLFIMRLFIRGL